MIRHLWYYYLYFIIWRRKPWQGLGLFQKYHKTLRCPSKILHNHCFQFLLGLRPIAVHSSSFLVLVTTEKSVANSYKEREIGREIVKHTTKSSQVCNTTMTPTIGYSFLKTLKANEINIYLWLWGADVQINKTVFRMCAPLRGAKCIFII